MMYNNNGRIRHHRLRVPRRIAKLHQFTYFKQTSINTLKRHCMSLHNAVGTRKGETYTSASQLMRDQQALSEHSTMSLAYVTIMSIVTKCKFRELLLDRRYHFVISLLTHSVPIVAQVVERHCWSNNMFNPGDLAHRCWPFRFPFGSEYCDSISNTN